MALHFPASFHVTLGSRPSAKGPSPGAVPCASSFARVLCPSTYSASLDRANPACRYAPRCCPIPALVLTAAQDEASPLPPQLPRVSRATSYTSSSAPRAASSRAADAPRPEEPELEPGPKPEPNFEPEHASKVQNANASPGPENGLKPSSGDSPQEQEQPGLSGRAGDGASASALRTLFPASQRQQHGYLQVSARHKLYYEVYGNPRGRPAVFLHGGPGAGCYPNHARFFDPAHFRIILFDQRGCGKSTPRGSLHDNTTLHLVDDLEKLRLHFGIHRWILLGGSWGATLALAYAQAHPVSTAGLILRGVCLMRQRDLDWLYRQGGLDALLPVTHSEFEAELSKEERTDPAAAYYRRLTSTNPSTRERAAKSWIRLEMAAMFSLPTSTHSASSQSPSQPQPTPSPPPAPSSSTSPSSPPTSPPPSPTPTATSTLLSPASSPPPSTAAATAAQAATPGPCSGPAGPEDRQPSARSTLPASPSSKADPDGDSSINGASMPSSVVQARLECHYVFNRGFFRENQLLEDVGRMEHVPGFIVHGRWDLVCPVKNAVDLHKAWPKAELRVAPASGHSMYDPAITHELLLATEHFKQSGPF